MSLISKLDTQHAWIFQGKTDAKYVIFEATRMRTTV